MVWAAENWPCWKPLRSPSPGRGEGQAVDSRHSNEEDQLCGAGQCCRATTFRVVCELSWGSLVGAAALLHSTLRLELVEGFDFSINH